jgi:hypothetical protein
MDTRRFRDCIHEKQKIRRRLDRRDGEFFYPNRGHHLAQQARHIAEQAYRAVDMVLRGDWERRFERAARGQPVSKQRLGALLGTGACGSSLQKPAAQRWRSGWDACCWCSCCIGRFGRSRKQHTARRSSSGRRKVSPRAALQALQCTAYASRTAKQAVGRAGCMSLCSRLLHAARGAGPWDGALFCQMGSGAICQDIP